MEKPIVKVHINPTEEPHVKVCVTAAKKPFLLPASTEHEGQRTQSSIRSALEGFRKGKDGVFEREIEDGVVLKVAKLPLGEGNHALSSVMPTIACVILSRYADGYERPLAAFEFLTIDELIGALSIATSR